MIKNVLITGGAGYVGTLLAPQLLAAGYNVTVYDIMYYGCEVKSHPCLKIINGDIRDTAKLRDECRGVDAVIHLACISNDAGFELDEKLSEEINYRCFEPTQTLAFPTTNIIVLTIADKRGAEEIAGWVSVLKLRYAGRIEIRGLADVGGVPGFLQGKIRKKFQASHTYPVMLDWSGNVCAQFGYEKNVANILILGRDGTILGRSTGPATEQAIQDFDSLLEKHLPPPAKH